MAAVNIYVATKKNMNAWKTNKKILRLEWRDKQTLKEAARTEKNSYHRGSRRRYFDGEKSGEKWGGGTNLQVGELLECLGL